MKMVSGRIHIENEMFRVQCSNEVVDFKVVMEVTSKIVTYFRVSGSIRRNMVLKGP